MRIVFISNYINHHQIPLSEALQELVGIGNYFFIATTPPAQEQLKLGYEDGNHKYPFVITTYDKNDLSEIIQLVYSADLVIQGSSPRYLAYRILQKRIQSNKIIFKYSERIFRKGIWRAYTPIRIVYMLLLHTIYRSRNIYLLCASAYLPYEMFLFNAYPQKMYKWGYFPPFHKYSIHALMIMKSKSSIRIIWVGRLIPLKHPEVIFEIAKTLVAKKINFTIEVVGTGLLENKIKQEIDKENLNSYIVMSGAVKPNEVRQKMEKSHILIATSDFREGWGAIINEAMNSGCVVIASHAMGAVPFLIKDGVNGYIYKYNDIQDLIRILIKIIKNKNELNKVGVNAYLTIEELWNPDVAASRLINLCNCLNSQASINYKDGPCSIAEIIPQNRMYDNICNNEEIIQKLYQG